MLVTAVSTAGSQKSGRVRRALTTRFGHGEGLRGYVQYRAERKEGPR